MNVQQLIKELYLSNHKLHEQHHIHAEETDKKLSILISQVNEINQKIEILMEQNQMILETIENNKNTSTAMITSQLDETERKIVEMRELQKFDKINLPNLPILDSNIIFNNDNQYINQSDNIKVNMVNKKNEMDNSLDQIISLDINH
jgi:hypothetical protein